MTFEVALSKIDFKCFGRIHSTMYSSVNWPGRQSSSKAFADLAAASVVHKSAGLVYAVAWMSVSSWRGQLRFSTRKAKQARPASAVRASFSLSAFSIGV